MKVKTCFRKNALISALCVQCWTKDFIHFCCIILNIVFSF